MPEPMTLLQLMEGARNCVTGYAGVQAGENVVLWLDGSPKVDSLVVQALALAVEEAGAKPTIIYDKPPIFRLGEDLSLPVERALQSADCTLQVLDLENLASIDNIGILRCLFEYDMRITAVMAVTAELMASEWARYPLELARAVTRKSAAMVKDAEFRLTDPNGTDLRGRLKAWPAGKGFSGSGGIRAGAWTFFPSGNVPLYPESPLNGTVVFETMEGFRGFLSEPVKLTVKDHWVTGVEGGYEARWLERMMKRYPNGNYFCELTWGTAPKASLSLGLSLKAPDTVLYRRAGVFHCGVGMWPGVNVFSEFHWDGGGLHPTLTIGDELVVDGGRLTVLDDPEVREIAAKYGHPDDLLAMAP